MRIWCGSIHIGTEVVRVKREPAGRAWCMLAPEVVHTPVKSPETWVSLLQGRAVALRNRLEAQSMVGDGKVKRIQNIILNSF